MGRRNPWVQLGLQTATLGWEAAQVAALRMAKLTAGGAAADAELERMVSEKVEAVLDVQALAISGALGFTAPRVASRTLAHYRRKVRSNRRRLLRSK